MASDQFVKKTSLIDNKILVTGASGVSGSAIVSALKDIGCTDVFTPTHKDLDLGANRGCIVDYFKDNQIQYVFHCAGIVGGHASNYTATVSDIMTEDIKINLNTINAAATTGVKKLIAIGGQWNYNDGEQIKEIDYDVSFARGGSGHDVSKYVLIALLKAMKVQGDLDSTTLMIPLLYNSNVCDNVNDRHPFLHIANSIYKASKNNLDAVDLKSTSKALRQMIHARDLASAAIEAIDLNSLLLNVAHDKVYSMEEIAKHLAHHLGFTGQINWANTSKNVRSQTMDCALLRSTGWKPIVELPDMIKEIK